MKLKYLFFLSIISISQYATAQFTPIGQSTSFDEPEDGFAKVLLLSNHNTAYVHIETKGKTEIKIYDPSFKEIASNENEMSYNNMNKGEVLGLFETQDGITIILSEYTEMGDITLFKALFDKNTGRVLNDEKLKIIKNPSSSFRKVFIQGFELGRKGGKPESFFKLVKDPAELSYSVLCYDATTDIEKNIEVLRFDDVNHLQSDTYLKPDDNKIAGMRLLNACNGPANSIGILVKGYYSASKQSKSNLGNIYLTTFSSDSNNSKFVKMNYPGVKQVFDAIMKYNPISRQYIILTVKQGGESSNSGKWVTNFSRKSSSIANGVDYSYSLFKTTYDINTNISQTTAFTSPMLIKTASVNYPQHKPFSFLPAEININQNGTYTIACEGRLLVPIYGDKGTRAFKVYKSDIGIVNYNSDNIETSAYYIPKYYFVFDYDLSAYNYLQGGVSELNQALGYRSFYFINNPGNSFVLLNDDYENGNRLEKNRKIEPIQGLGNCLGYYFNVSGNEDFPKRNELFSSDDGKRPIGLFAASDYDKTTHTFVTLKLDRSHPKEGVQIVWYKLD